MLIFYEDGERRVRVLNTDAVRHLELLEERGARIGYGCVWAHYGQSDALAVYVGTVAECRAWMTQISGMALGQRGDEAPPTASPESLTQAVVLGEAEDIPLRQIFHSHRLHRCLTIIARIETLGQLVLRSRREIMRIYSFGSTTWELMLRELHTAGLTLRLGVNTRVYNNLPLQFLLSWVDDKAKQRLLERLKPNINQE